MPGLTGWHRPTAVEKRLKCWIFLGDREPPLNQALNLLASEANLEFTNLLLDLQPFAVGARDQDGNSKLPTNKTRVLEEIQLLADQLRQAIEARASTNL